MKSLKKISFKYHIRQITACFLSIWLFFGPSIAWASITPDADTIPTGVIGTPVGVGPMVSGSGTLAITQTASEAIINWDNFDIGADASVQFLQPGAAAAVLNRVHDGDPTGIMGDLMANGTVFIVNPAGIVFGSGASVNVAQLIASSLNITDTDFLAGDLIFDGDNFEGFDAGYVATITGDGQIINNGTIGDSANPGGTIPSNVALIGKSILNTGTIVTQAGGIVVMAAGDKVLLGEPGGKIIVEMSSATGDMDGVGTVTNEGSITSPGGQVVLAAGDIYSIPLHPQLQNGTIEDRDYDYTDDDDQDVIDLQPVRVELGTGTVTQDGAINTDGVDGDGGTVVLTAADKADLTGTSVTSAQGISDTGSEGGEVIVYASNLGDKDAIADFQEGAVISVQAKPTTDPPPLAITSDTVFKGGLAEIHGDSTYFEGTVEAVTIPFEITDPDNSNKTILFAPDGGGKLIISGKSMTIKDGPLPPATGAEENVVYENVLENYSVWGQPIAPTGLSHSEELAYEQLDSVDISLTGETLVSAERLGNDLSGPSADPGLVGGSGGFEFRNSYDTGAVIFNTEDTISAGAGTIDMIAGSGGIVVGDITTDLPSNEKAIAPGMIRLLTGNGGDIRTGNLSVTGGYDVEISAIADGTLIVNGNAIAIRCHSKR